MKIKQNMKRKLALLLSGVLLMQTVFTGATGGAQNSEEREGSSIAGTPMALKGTPNAAFKNLQLTIGNKVGDDNALFLSLYGTLRDSYLQNTLEPLVDDGTILDEGSWDEADQGYSSYYSYLNAQTALPEIHFSVALNFEKDSLAALDIGKKMTGDIITNPNGGDLDNQVIGRYELIASDSGTSSRLEVTFDKMLYACYNIGFSKSIFASFTGNSEADAEVTVRPGGGSNDFWLDIPNYKEEFVNDSNFEITKNDNKHNDNDPNLTYTISAKVKGTTTLKASKGEIDDSKPEISKSKVKKVASSSEPEEDKTLDPDNDEDWEIDGDASSEGPGLSDLIDLLVPKRDKTDTISSYSELSDITLTDTSLSGYEISDIIPEGLTITKVESRINSSAESAYKLLTQDAAENGYSFNEFRVFTYKIPDLSDENDVIAVDLRITTRLSDIEYNKFLILNPEKEMTWNFTNKALLKYPGENAAALTKTPNVASKITLASPFTKEEIPISHSEGKFQWKLKVNSQFSSSNVTLYAVDHIKDITNTHNYIPGSPITINPSGGSPQTVTAIELEEQSAADYSFNKITSISAINALLEANAEKIAGDTTSPIVYYYEASSTVSASEDMEIASTMAPEKKYDAIMLVPLSEYTNRPVTITYDTQAVQREDLFGNGPLKLQNFAKILWKWEGGGDGIGPGEEFGGASIDKDANYNCTLVDKSVGAGYSEEFNTIDWKFEINQIGISAKEITITDTLTNAEQIFWSPKDGETRPITLTALGGSSGMRNEIPYKTDGTGDYYEIKPNQTDATKTDLIVHLTDIASTEHYSFNIQTFIVNPGLMSSNADAKVENNADVSVIRNDGDDPVTFQTGDKTTVKNTLIRKESIKFENDSSYNYEDNTVKWRVRINPRYWSITEPLITDTLPAGTQFAELTSVVRKEKDKEGVSLTFTKGDEGSALVSFPYDVYNGSQGSIKVSQLEGTSELVFQFLDSTNQAAMAQISEEYIFEFTTQVTDTWRKENLKSGKNQNPELVNTAKLTGYWTEAGIGTRLPIAAEDKATNKLLPVPMTKNGQYITPESPSDLGQLPIEEENKASGVKWTLYVNRTKADFTGATITDNIEECMELLTDSMKVSIVHLDAKGNERTDIEPEVIYSKEAPTHSFKALEYNKFAFQIPDSSHSHSSSNDCRKSTLKFEFYTVMVDDAYKSEIKNKVSIEWDGKKDSTEDENAKDAADFFLDDYAFASALGLIKLSKTSTNQAADYPLLGASFKIGEMIEPAAGADRTVLRNWGEPTSDKTRVTNLKGSLSFMFLKPDMMYKITEEKAPNGYAETNTIWYVIPKPTSDLTYPDSAPGDNPAYVVEKKTGTKNYHTMTVKNAPQTPTGGEGVFSFKKSGQNGQILPDAIFMASNASLNDRTAISDKNGDVIFSALEPNEKYTIREISANGYLAGKSLYVKTEWDAANKKVIATLIEDKIPTEFFDKETNTYKNKEIKQTGVFTKTNQNDEALTSESVTFKVSRRGDGGELLSASGNGVTVCLDVDKDIRMSDSTVNTQNQVAADYYEYLPKDTVTSDSTDGTVKLEDFLYGDYMLEEANLPGGAVSGSNKAVLYIRVNESGMYASKNDFYKEGRATEGKPELSFTTDSKDEPGTKLQRDASSYTVSNMMQYGMVQINKALGEKNSSGVLTEVTTAGKLEGIPFKIYKDLGNGGKELFLNLATNKEGQFTVNSDGSYTDVVDSSNRWLLTGDYILEEQAQATSGVEDKYKLPAEHKFEIASWGSGMTTPSTLYIGWNGNTYLEVTGDLDGSSSRFLNEPERGTVTLTKKDRENDTIASLTGAAFKVWTSKDSTNAARDYVADLVEIGSTGEYTLKIPTGLSGTDWAETKGNKKYLMPADPRNSASPLAILYGDYYLEEITAPTNYEKPTSRILVKVAAANVIKLPNNSDITNTVMKANIEFEKRIEVRKQLNATSFETAFDSYKYADADKSKFGFTLTKKTLQGGKFDTVQKFTDKDGKVKFENVPIGTYTLTETAIPTIYGESVNGSYVEVMKPITVTVTEEIAANGTKTSKVTFTDASNNTFPEPITPETGAASQLITVSDAGNLVVRNNYKFGEAHGTKVGIHPTDSSNPLTMSGIDFTLTNTANLSMTVKSDSSGNLNFTNLPYGSYTLTEKAPMGYVGESILFSVDDANKNVVIKNNNTSGKIDNKLILKTVKFPKVDQNNDPLDSGRADIEFTITRDQSSIPGTLPGSINWTQGQTVSVDPDGYVTFTDLPYGTYTVTEDISDAANVIERKADPFTITIGRDSDNSANTKVTMKSENPKLEKSISLKDETDGGGIYDFTKSPNVFPVQNTVKSGDIKISKKLGELQSDGTVADGNKKLGNITFNIYKQDPDTGAPFTDVFATLTTNSDGEFEKDADGKYGGKELLVGSTYYLKEEFLANSIYKPLPAGSEYIEFTVKDKKAVPQYVTRFEYEDGVGDIPAMVFEAVDFPNPPAFYNVPQRGTITVTKQDAGDSSVLSGTEFGIYTDSDCTNTNKVASLKEDSTNPGTYILDGSASTAAIPYLSDASGEWKILKGTYWIKETKAPTGYMLLATVEQVTVEDDVDSAVIIKNTMAQANVKFLKVDQNRDPVRDTSDGKRKITFTLARVPSPADEPTAALDNRATAIINAPDYPVITNSTDGIVTVTGLIAGNYTLTENTPQPSWISGSPPVMHITVTQEQNDSLTVTLGSTSPAIGASDKKQQNITPPASGKAMFDFSTGNTIYQLENQLTYGLVDIVKVAAEINDNNNLTPLTTPISGVVFKVYEDVNADGKYQSAADLEKLTLVTGEDGKFKRSADNKYENEQGVSQSYRLVYGKSYLLKEVKLPSRDDLDQKFQIDEHYYAFKIGSSTYYYIGTKENDDVKPEDIQHVTETDAVQDNILFPNAPIRRGNVILEKTDAALSNQPVKGAEFAVYTNSGEKRQVARLADNNTDGTYELQPIDASQPDKPENSSGQAYLKKMTDDKYYLLGGKYYIKETKAPAGYMTPEDKAENYWYFTVAGNGETVINADLTTSSGQTKAFTNSLWSRNITVQKMVENLSPDKFHAAGTQPTDDSFIFKLESKSGATANGKPFTPVTKTIEAAGTNQGKAVFANIPAGEYTITEIMTEPAKQGGILSDIYATPKTISVTVNEKGVFYNGSATNATQFTVQNLLKRGSITGHKITMDAQDKPVNLANAEFTLTPVSPARAGTLTAVSNSKGEFTFQNLPLGEYDLRETKTPDASYTISDKTYRVKVTAENQNVTTDTAFAKIEFVNYATGSFTIEKQEQVIRNNDMNGTMVPGQGFSFKITGASLKGDQLQDFFNAANVAGAASVEKKEDGIYVTTDVTGIITFKNLPMGVYTVMEQINDKTSETGAYIPDEKEKTVTITIDHATGKVAVTPKDGVKVDNYLKRSQIEGLKTTSDKTTPLAGAVIGLFPAGTTTFTEENLWCGQKVTTGADGKYLFQKLPYGTYMIAELEAPSGYHLNTTTRYEVTVADDKTVKTTGFLLEGTEPKAAAESPILITNTKKSSGGGGGGGGGDDPKPPKPTGPGPGTPTTSPNESSPVGPGETIPGVTNPGETTPNNPLPTIPVETAPGGGNEVIIPPETPPGSDLEIKDPNGDTVFVGKVDENGRVHVELPPGTYTLVTFDENQVPLGSMTFTIEDPFTPLGMLAAPNAGDSSVSIVVLAVLMMISLAGMVLVVIKKKEEKQNPDGKE